MPCGGGGIGPPGRGKNIGGGRGPFGEGCIMGGGGNLGIRIIGGIEGGGPNPAMGPRGRGG